MRLITYIISTSLLVLLHIVLNNIINIININLSSLTLDEIIFEIIFYANFAPIWLIPAIVIDAFDKKSKWYLVGINLDKYAIRDIFFGGAAGLITISIISVLALVLGADFNAIFLQEANSVKVFERIFENSTYIFNSVAVEELVFRGFIFQYFLRKSNNTGLLVFISSAVFAAGHFINGSTDILTYINTFIAGVLFCLMYIKTRSLWLPFSFHFMWNWSMLVLFNKLPILEQTALQLAANSTYFVSDDTFFKIIFENFNFLVAVLFGTTSGFEGGVLCTIILIIMIFFITKYGKPSYNINAAIFKYEYISILK